MNGDSTNTNNLPWSLASRLRPPTTAAFLIDRPRLNSVIREIQPGSLFLACAPAGFGKTTLLAACHRDAVARPDLVSAWLSVKPDDEDPIVLARRMLLAVGTAARAQGREVSVADMAATAAMEPHNLVDVVSGLGAHVCVFLDDVHAVAPDTASAVINDLIEWQPPNLTIFLGTRAPPKLHLGRIRAAGRCVELAASELLFTVDEARACLAGLCAEHVARQVHAETGGWPLALQLARRFFQQHAEQRAEAPRFTGRTETVAEYFAEEIVPSQPPDTLEFLDACSILDDFDADIMNAVCECDDAQKHLAAAEGLQPLLMFTPDARLRYRLNQLFREFLAARLRRSRTLEEIRALHSRAATWLAREGQFAAALRHGVEAADSALISAVFDAVGGLRGVVHVGSTELRAICASLPELAFDAAPRLRLARAAMLASAGRVREARGDYETARRRTAGFNESDGDLVALRNDAKVAELYLTIYGDLDVSTEYLADLERLVDERGVDDPPFRFLGLLFLVVYYQQYGNLVKARARCAEFMRIGGVVGGGYADVIGECYAGLAAYAQGDLDRAQAALSRAIERAERSSRRETGISLIGARIHLGEVLYERGEISAAARHVADVLPRLARAEGWFDAYAAGFGLAAKLAHQTDGADAAIATCERMLDVAERGGQGRSARLARAYLADILSREERWPEVTELIGDYAHIIAAKTLGVRDIRTWREFDATACAIIRWALGVRRRDLALALIQDYRARGQRQHRLRPVVKSHLFESMLHLQDGEMPAAMAALADALVPAAAGGLVQTLRDERRRLERVASRVLACRGDLSERAYLHACLAFERVAQSECLSQREFDVLVELAGGRTNKAIGRRLNLSENTVKTHLKALYAKLGVTKRADAVEAGRQRALISEG